MTTSKTLSERPQGIDKTITGVLSNDHKNALYNLSAALKHATNTGLFDLLAIHPDDINSFCDEILERHNSEFKEYIDPLSVGYVTKGI